MSTLILTARLHEMPKHYWNAWRSDVTLMTMFPLGYTHKHSYTPGPGPRI